MSIKHSAARITVLACAAIGAAVGIAVQTLRLAIRSQEYHSLAVVVATNWPQAEDSYVAAAEDHARVIIEVLESSEMRRRALERVRALNPEPKETKLEFRVAQAKGSAVFNILATGREPKFTRVYLDALLDEVMAWQKEMAGRMEGGDPNKPQLVAIQSRASPSTRIVEDWTISLGFGAVMGAIAAAAVWHLATISLLSGKPHSDDQSASLSSIPPSS